MESSPLKAAEDTSQKIKVYPLLSPDMESSLLNEPWPQLATNTQIKSNTLWGENFQDLSNWCVVDPQKVSPVAHTAQLKGQHAIQKHQDYHIGEEIKPKNSGVKDNYDNLSHNKSELKDIEEILGEHNRTVDKNIISTGEGGIMSFDGYLPIGQDEFNTIKEISDIWFDQSPAITNSSTGMDDEQNNITYISNNQLLISDTSSNENLLMDHNNVDLIGETIANWLPIDITNQNICNDLVTNINIQFDNFVSNEHQTASVNFNNDDKLEKKHTINDLLLTTEVGSDSFDLLSYVCNEDCNLQDRKNTDQEKGKEKSDTSDEKTQSLEIGNINNINDNDNTSSDSNKNTRRSCREKRITKSIKEKIDPYNLPPIRINVKNNKILSVKKSSKRTLSKQTDNEQESCGNYTDSDDSDTTQTSDYNYRELREKNNMASRKSRINKKVKESEMMKRANDLERNNAVLKMRVEELEKLVTSMRTALLQSALKKEKN